MSPISGGRRERKKAATRQALADAAIRLFLERGFDRVSVKDIADAADVSTTTLFKHFASKEALVFDEDDDREAELVAAVRERAPGQSIPQALCAHFVRSLSGNFSHPRIGEFVHLVNSTPALYEYGRRMWTRHALALARAIAEVVRVPPEHVACVALARFALEAPNLARGHADPAAVIAGVFALLENGWASAVAAAQSR